MQDPKSGGMTLAILSAALGTAFSGTAHADLVSTVPAGFQPVSVTPISSGTPIDLDGNGTTDFTLGGTLSGIALTEANPATSGTGSLGNLLHPTPNPSTLSIGNVKSNSGTVYVENQGDTGYQSGELEYVELAINATFADSAAIAGTLGYMEGVYTAGEIPGFTLYDYGLVTSPAAVPEPASLALLATGAAGIAALRRRRRRAA